MPSKNPLEEIQQLKDAETLDRALKAAPSQLSDADLDGVIAAARGARARFIAADALKAQKREGVQQPVDMGDEEPEAVADE